MLDTCFELQRQLKIEWGDLERDLTASQRFWWKTKLRRITCSALSECVFKMNLRVEVL